MKTQADKTQDNKSRSATKETSQKQSITESAIQFTDNRPEAIQMQKLHKMANNCPQVKQLKGVQEIIQVNNAKDNIVQRVAKGNLINFKTKSMSDSGAATLHHEVFWESSTGDLADLTHIRTREQISWDAAPPEFGPTGEYTSPGIHNGLGSNTANGGRGGDDHSIIPPGFNFQLPEDGISRVWKMNQTYEMQVDGGEWIPIPGAQYQITRWFERKGNDMIAYTAKRGINDGSMLRAVVECKDWFKARKSKKVV